jgi:hypothetical protein
MWNATQVCRTSASFVQCPSHRPQISSFFRVLCIVGAFQILDGLIRLLLRSHCDLPVGCLLSVALGFLVFLPISIFVDVSTDVIVISRALLIISGLQRLPRRVTVEVRGIFIDIYL